MKHPQYPLVLTGLALATAFSLALGAAAQTTSAPGAAAAPAVDSAAQATAQAMQARIAQSPIPAEFGTSSYSILQIPAAAFRARKTGATITTDYFEGTIYPGEVTSNFYDYWAPVFLPEGALIQWMDLFACDSNATNHVSAVLSGYSGFTTPALTDFNFNQLNSQQVVSAPNCGYWSNFFFPEQVVNNNVRYDGGYHYVVNVQFAAGNSTNRLKGVDFWWRRQVSPAPVSARFTDVTTGHPYFQFIEALAASGITTGCQVSPAKYCPDQFVTRGQMAVFLARALGLHWPL